MTQAIKRGHTLALLTAAALAVCLCPALVSAQTVPPLDHFKCYLSAEIPSAAGVFPGTEVFLQDQFTPAGVLIPSFAYRPVRFCNPVKKTLPDGTVTPVSDFNAHLTLYTLASSVLHPSRRVVISNQFGQKRLMTTQPIALLVPTAKNTQPPPEDLDHFECYRATGPTLRVKPQLSDQFQDTTNRVVRPIALCNPVTKRHGDIVTPIKHPDDHLVCYSITPVDFSGQAQIRNQFQAAVFGIKAADILCVPSKKLSVTVIP